MNKALISAINCPIKVIITDDKINKDKNIKIFIIISSRVQSENGGLGKIQAHRIKLTTYLTNQSIRNPLSRSMKRYVLAMS